MNDPMPARPKTLLHGSGRRRNGLRLAFATVALLALAACESSEERAERHYESALNLLENGDVPRALVELRTVFSLEPTHRAARATMARTQLEQGNLQAAFNHYTRLVEQYPNDTEARLILGELSILGGNWQLAAEHGRSVIQLAPDSARAQVIDTALAYRNAVIEDDARKRAEAAERARALEGRVPDSVINASILVDSLILDEEYRAALDKLDEVQERFPQERRFYQMRLTAHGRLNEPEGIEETLRRMISVYPEDTELATTLLTFYRDRGDIDGAERFLRDRVVPTQVDDGARLSVVQFLNNARGPEAALEEAEFYVREGTNDDLFRALAASLRYDLGQRREALESFEDIVRNAEPSEQTNDIKVSYAQILEREGNEVASRALIEEVLEADPTHVNALVLRAQWMIAADLVDEAILVLRRAQDQDPENARVFSLMARAHLRNGARDLAGEMLALAVDASNKAPEETLAYATFLITEGRLLPAETVLVDALRIAPRNFQLLSQLGDVYVRLRDWPRAEQVERAVRSIGGEAASLVADQLRVAILRGQQRDEDAVAFLRELSQRQGGYRAAEIAIVTTQLERGNIDEAKAYLDELLETDPLDPSLRFLKAAVDAATGNSTAAEREYRDLIARGEGGERVWMELVRLLNRTGRTDEAQTVLNAALEQNPAAADLQWMRATFLERQNDFEGAIAIYEELYEQNSSTSVIANNLASLLSTVRDDEESLQRAAVIARRLRGTDFPAYQDTYGWIQFRLGDPEEALDYLREAARGLPTDPLVQHHLGMTYDALGRYDEAIRQFERALELAGDDPRAAFDTARAKLEELQNRDSAAGSADGAIDALPSVGGGSVDR